MHQYEALQCIFHMNAECLAIPFMVNQLLNLWEICKLIASIKRRQIIPCLVCKNCMMTSYKRPEILYIPVVSNSAVVAPSGIENQEIKRNAFLKSGGLCFPAFLGPSGRTSIPPVANVAWTSLVELKANASWHFRWPRSAVRLKEISRKIYQVKILFSRQFAIFHPLFS